MFEFAFAGDFPRAAVESVLRNSEIRSAKDCEEENCVSKENSTRKSGGGGCGDENFLWSYFLPSCPSAAVRLRSFATVAVVVVVAIVVLRGWLRRKNRREAALQWGGPGPGWPVRIVKEGGKTERPRREEPVESAQESRKKLCVLCEELRKHKE